MATRVVSVKIERGWIPTRKWIAAQVVAVGAIATSAIVTGWNVDETTACVAWAVQAATTYLLPNAAAPGGVPDSEIVPGTAKVEGGTSHVRGT